MESITRDVRDIDSRDRQALQHVLSAAFFFACLDVPRLCIQMCGIAQRPAKRLIRVANDRARFPLHERQSPASVGHGICCLPVAFKVNKRQRSNAMRTRFTCLFALAVLAAPAWEAHARADDPEEVVAAYLNDLGVNGYTLSPVTDECVADSFPDVAFVAVHFREWPLAVIAPDGFASRNLAIVHADDSVTILTAGDDLKAYFFDQLAAVENADDAEDAACAWLRLSQEFTQDQYYVFLDPIVQVRNTDTGFHARGQVGVDSGGTGKIHVRMIFDINGDLDTITQTSSVRPGVRPICQATMLLHSDPLVRRMAEQDIVVMGSAAKGYLDEQRAKASPELRKEIDRVWKRIVDEGR
jgi:hypothetical protein